ncbi:hypothetical protein BU26DRAFT_488470 [Trematosphaeria pertusa]|uniref:Uncharacterized protein n=1 Tax=Trematosphaeria pertusa TaxID=390896 RepID=A0A6A6I663_9PLEO|nr:uncharacterized protein BU26DRAFT_488470 [Trematosphaeria pertusa]KAF2245817.1 hypothetical protein BU26DRAFT_488470 [Trematosphaeria pertusa]
MANQKALYYFAPTWDYPPTGPIKLGAVLATIDTPERPLALLSPSETDVFSSTKSTVQYSKEKLRSGGFSILTTFLSFLGFGADAGLSRENSSFSFDRIETSQFIPTDAYVRKCAEAGPVRRYLEKARYRKPVYIITGVKVVSGAQARTATSQVRGGAIGLEVDGTVWSGGMVPVSGGPQIELAEASDKETSWEWSGDFVFAFRVSRVRVQKTGTVQSEKPYAKGAMLDNGEEAKLSGVEITIVEEEGAAPEEGYKAVELMEGYDAVNCGLLATSWIWNLASPFSVKATERRS